MPRMKAVFSKLCPDAPEFSAATNIRISDGQGTLRMTYPVKLAMTGDFMRQEFDATKMSQMPTEERANLKLAHLDQIVVITRGDKKTVCIVFPGVQCYCEYSIPAEVLNEVTTRPKAVTIQKTELGSATVNERSCTKTKLTASEPNRPTEEAILWSPTDMPQFPIKMEIYAKQGTTTFDFQDVSVKKPNATMFEVPPNYIQFSSPNAILAYAKEKLNGGGNVAPK